MSITEQLLAAAGVSPEGVVAVEYRHNLDGDAWVRVTTADGVLAYPVKD